MQIYLVSALIFSLLVAVFAIQNTEVVVIQFLTWNFSVSLVLVILGSAVVGALALFFLSLFRQVGSWVTIRQLNHRKEELEKQLKKLEEKNKDLESEKTVQQEEKIASHQEEQAVMPKETVNAQEGAGKNL